MLTQLDRREVTTFRTGYTVLQSVGQFKSKYKDFWSSLPDYYLTPLSRRDQKSADDLLNVEDCRIRTAKQQIQHEIDTHIEKYKVVVAQDAKNGDENEGGFDDEEGEEEEEEEDDEEDEELKHNSDGDGVQPRKKRKATKSARSPSNRKTAKRKKRNNITKSIFRKHSRHQFTLLLDLNTPFTAIRFRPKAQKLLRMKKKEINTVTEGADYIQD
eukprot:TRINITY_DN3985_c0_g1_i1.p1 TRINITY_DN3985_c0_g1~~TRINITY_DN3985_c0_g1_i1.p1  ORF type:complete len:214 (-),score=52.37 TRINITY_DN3985_c0_g1_i1:308-949(-)